MGRDMYTDLAEELSSSYVWQSTVFSRRSAERFHFMDLMLFFSFSEAVCEDPPVCPTVCSSAIEWEQSIIEGHPTHPVRVFVLQSHVYVDPSLARCTGPVTQSHLFRIKTHKTGTGNIHGSVSLSCPA